MNKNLNKQLKFLYIFGHSQDFNEAKASSAFNDYYWGMSWECRNNFKQG